MKKFTRFFLSALLFSQCIIAESGFTSNLLFVAQLTGEYEVPPVVTTAIGDASFALNATRDSLCINVTVKGLSGPISGAHIHEGPIGGNGPITLDLTNNIIGNRISTIITAPTLDSLFIAKLLNDSFYINVHTANNPGGEIRGQIELEEDWAFLIKLDGDQETPPVVTGSSGLAIAFLSRSMTTLHIKGVFENFTEPITGIHLHSGATGVSGPIESDLIMGLNGNRLDISVAPDSFITELMTGQIYLNVHTNTNPTGEIRGQLIRQHGLVFDASLDGNQESPPVTTSGWGVGMVSINGAKDSIWVDFIYDSLTSVPSGAHFHSGAMGVSGPVIVDLTTMIDSNRIQGVITGSSIPAGFADSCLTGNVYINLHTGANPNGEIRGQLKRFAREGFTYVIDASQETSGSTSTAMGSGMASIDRDGDNLHFRMIVTGLTDTIQAAHFHNAPVGQDGLIIFDLFEYFSRDTTDDAAFNYWLSTAAFDSTKIIAFLNNEVYVNLHTSTHPNGEVRGQIIRGGVCNILNTSIPVAVPLAIDFNIYPNPLTDDELTVSFNSLTKDEGKLLIYDISGRLVLVHSFAVFNGINSLRIPVEIQPGVYTLKLDIGGNNQIVSGLMKH